MKDRTIYDISPSQPEVSVIVPVYNVESYIEECALSLFNQTLESIEYIFIDDASTDSSLKKLNKIIDSFPERKNQIKIIRHKENKGISFTRQEGVGIATGKWIIHCDADDILDYEMYQKLLDFSKIHDADLVFCSYKIFNSSKKYTNHLQGEGKIEVKEYLSKITGTSKQTLHGALWNKLIKAHLAKKIEFIKNISYCEDVLYLINLINNNPNLKIYSIPEFLYTYRMRKNSLIEIRGKQRQQDLEILITNLELTINKIIITDSFIYSLIIQFLYRYLETEPDLKYFSIKYKKYKNYIGINKRLNKFEQLHLVTALNELFILSKAIGYLNKKGRKLIKTLKYFVNFKSIFN